jgi:hypothetical protein
MTEPIRKTMEAMTGYNVGTCPWRAFHSPFVRRVRTAMSFFESGQLAFACPFPSYKLVQGIAFYQGASNRMQGKQLDLDRETRKRDAETAAAERQANRGR